MGAGVTSNSREDIYHYDRIFNRALKRLYSSTDVCEEDKVNISRMVEHLLAKGVSKGRAVKYIYHLLVLARVAGKPFKSLRREDIERLVSWINASDYTDHTKHDYKVILKKFYQWLRGCNEEEHEYPEEVRWIKTKLKRILSSLLYAWIVFFSLELCYPFQYDDDEYH